MTSADPQQMEMTDDFFGAPVGDVGKGKTWSAYQEAIFEEFSAGSGHLVIEAVAGSGKTTTILEGIRRIRPGLRVLFCAFNRETADVLAAKVPAGVDANTTHGVGFRAVRWAWRKLFPKIDLDGKRERKLALALERRAGAEWSNEDRDAMLALVGFAKAWVLWDPARLRKMAAHYAIEPARRTMDEIVARAVEVIVASMEPAPFISYDDMTFLPVALGLRPKAYDLVVVDETQDLNRSQVELALMSLAPGGRIVAVGDSRQAIYAFRGADKDSMKRLVKRLGAKTMPLSVTYRCPPEVVAHVQRYVPHIEPSPAAAPGLVAPATAKDMLAGWGVGDFVLSRVNAPLVRLCVRAWRRNIPAVVLGKDVGRVVREMVDRYAGDTVGGLIEHVVAWGAREEVRLTKAQKEDQIDMVRDRVETIVALCEDMASLGDLRVRIDRLFAEPQKAGRDGHKTGVDLATKLVFASTHKAKGLEADAVWVLQRTYLRDDSEEEQNLYYVACTRAMRRLHLVTWDHKREEP